MSEETYRYDALGRRIYAREVRGANCANKDQSSGCRSTITRTIWDGDQIVAEIRIPGDSFPGGGNLELDNPEGTAHQGVVRYLHAGGIDQPLALWKDQLFELYANWRGAIVQATCPSAPCAGDAIYLPATVSSVFGAPPAYPNGPPSWHGSLVEGSQDASGLQYRRNRYYDARTGRFTQEDPIGLAGGMNAYGFASGDPVNFADPFGLCEKAKDNEKVTDCEKFAQMLDEMAKQAKSDEAFIRDLGKVFAGFPDGHVTTDFDPVDEALGLGGTGFRAEFNDGDGHPWRHFAAFVVAGYDKGFLAAGALASLWEFPGKKGASREDINLGVAGAALGRSIKKGWMSRKAVGQWVRDNL